MAWHSGWWSYLSDTGEKPKVTWDLMRRVLRYARPYRMHITGMLVLILINTGLTLLTPLILRDLIDRTIPARNLSRLVWLALALLAIPALGGVINVFQRRLNAWVGEGVIFDLRVALFSRLQRMSLRFFTNTKVGELMSRLNNDVVGAQNAISNTIVGIITNIIQATAVLIVMLTLEWRLTLVSIIILPLFIIVARQLGNRLRIISRDQMEANARMNAMMNETLNIGGALLVKLFGRTRVEIERFENRASGVRDLGIFRAVTGASFFVIIGLISAVGTALVYGIGGYLVIRAVFTVGTIVAFGAYLTSLYASLQGLSNAPVEFATSMVSFERVFEVIDLPLEISEKPGAVELQDTRGELVFDKVTFRYSVSKAFLLREVQRPGRMDNVQAVLSDGASKGNGAIHGGARDGNAKDGAKPSAATEGTAQASREGGNGHARAAAASEMPETAPREGMLDELAREGALGAEEMPHTQARDVALEAISFTAMPGQLVALVGPSGAGKTTLTYLIPRLYDPTSGRILIDGHDLRDVTLESLTPQIGMVTQETYLFHDTIRTNLLYANLDATQAQIEFAARAANIHDFIMELSDGYDTVVGERGYRLSGGEKQRLALARVILKDPRILVLDEATSHLDSESEALIQDALKRVMAGRTSIAISSAHRLSTILAADQILVMDRGQIVERGTHHALLALHGLYAQLYHTQFSRGNMTEITLPLKTVQTLLLHAQGLLRPPSQAATKESVLDAIRRMGALQIDTIHVVARSPYLVLFSRLGAYDPAWLDALLAEGRLFEYWAHAACFLPIEDYPLYRPRMPVLIQQYYSGERIERYGSMVERIMDHIHANGPVRSADFERTDRKSSGWWDWKEEKQVLEYLHTSGALMISRRERFQRVYDLRARVFPGWDSGDALTWEAAIDILAARAVRHLGAAPARWVPDYFRLPKRDMAARLERLAENGLLERVTVAGFKEPWYVHRENLSALEWALSGELAPTYTTLLSPFDPLVWDRERARTLFDFDFTLECYVPAAKRRYGYFLLPILHEGELIGRLDAKAHRQSGIFEVRALYLEPRVHPDDFLVESVAQAIMRCAAWHRTPQVTILKSDPEGLAEEIVAAIASAIP